MLMLISLLEKVELTSELHVRLSASALELRTVLAEPDLASATHHDLNSTAHPLYSTHPNYLLTSPFWLRRGQLHLLHPGRADLIRAR